MARKQRKTTRPKLTRADVERAIFIDYEGNAPVRGNPDHPQPTLLGYLIDGKLNAGVIEPIFAQHCSGRYRATHAVAADHVQLVTSLLERAEKEDRVIVSWSEHDLKQMIRVVPKVEGRLRAVHRNAIKPVRKYLRERNIAPQSGQTTLYGVCELLGIGVVDRYGIGLVGNGLRLIRSQLGEGRNYGELTPGARKAWQVIAKHNKQDLETMQEVLCHAIP